jgi:hypothetical protein
MDLAELAGKKEFLEKLLRASRMTVEKGIETGYIILANSKDIITSSIIPGNSHSIRFYPDSLDFVAEGLGKGYPVKIELHFHPPERLSFFPKHRFIIPSSGLDTGDLRWLTSKGNEKLCSAIARTENDNFDVIDILFIKRKNQKIKPRPNYNNYLQCLINETSKLESELSLKNYEFSQGNLFVAQRLRNFGFATALLRYRSGIIVNTKEVEEFIIYTDEGI